MDNSLKDIITLKKYKDIYDIKSIEVIIALVISIVMIFILLFNVNKSNISKIMDDLINILDALAVGLIGLLGFVIAGLALITSTLSNKLFKFIEANGKSDSLKRILLSFYLLGIILAFVIIASIIIHIWVYIIGGSDKGLFLLITFLFSYMIIFSILYSVKLVGNCYELFLIINNLNDAIESESDNFKK